MTLSVLAFDRPSGAIGCAAATGNLAVGAWVLRAAARVGAVATQGTSVSSLWGDEALARLAAGEAAEEVVTWLTQADPGRDHRQLAVLDAAGQAAAWTGAANEDAKGHIIDRDCVFAGNWLSGPAVLEAMAVAFAKGRANGSGEDPLPGAFGRRLLATLEAGAGAGSDARGTFSAAIRIVRPDSSPLDLRVDYDEDPLRRLGRLYEMATQPPYSDWAEKVPTLEDPYRA